MAQTPIVEGNYAGAHIVDEPSEHISRKKVTIKSGENLKAGAVLAKQTSSSKYVELNPSGSGGTEVAAAVLFDNTHADGADVEAIVHLRDVALNAQEVVWKSGMTAGEITSATKELDALSIVLR